MGMSNQCLTLYWLLAVWENQSIQGFTIGRPNQYRYWPELVQIRSSSRDDDELVPVRRQRRKPYYDDDATENDYDDDRTGFDEEEDNDYDDEEENDYEDDDDDESDLDDVLEYWEEILDKWDPTEHPLLGNEIVPNALLDNIDPDGSADRFHEIARDWRFWLDLLLVVIALDFLSLTGPHDTFPLLPTID